MEPGKLPVVELTCPRSYAWLGRALVLVAAVAVCIWLAPAAGAIWLIVKEVHSPRADRELPIEIVNAVHAGPWLFASLAFILAGRHVKMRSVASRYGLARFRGTKLAIGADGLTVSGPEDERVIPWHEVARVPLTRSSTVVITRLGDEHAFPLGAFHRRETEWHGRSAYRVDPSLVRSVVYEYWQAAVRGQSAAVDEEPRAIFSWANTDPPRPTQSAAYIRLGCVAAGLVLFLGMIVDIGRRSMGVGGALLMAGIMCGGLVAVVAIRYWGEMRRPAEFTRVQADAQGISYTARGKKHTYGWAEVERVSGTPGTTTHAALRVAGSRSTLVLPPVAHANLEALQRAKSPLRASLLAAVAEHYMQDGRETSL